MSAKAIPLPFPETPLGERPEPLLAPLERQDSPTPARSAKRACVWLAVHFPSWPLTAALSKLSQDEQRTLAGQAVATVDDDRKRRVLACNETALKRGVRAGHAFNAAIALCPKILLLERDRAQETRLLAHAAQLCQQYTPVVSIEEPDELLLEVRGSLKLFGGLEALLSRIESTFGSRGFTTQVAVAPTPESALWLVRCTGSPRIVRPRELRTALGTLSIATLRWPPDIELRLNRFGVRTLGDLLRLPRAGLARRIGAGRLTELDRAMGRQASLRKSFRTAEKYSDRVVLDFEIETTSLLGTVLLRCLDRLALFLRHRELSIPGLSIDLVHRDQKLTPLRIGLASATADMVHVGKLVLEALHQLTLAAPIIEVLVKAEQLLPAVGHALDLFAKDAGHIATHEERQARLIEQFNTRFGPSMVRSLQACADYRPECAQRRHPCEARVAHPQGLPPEDMPRRPLWLLREPQLVSRDPRDAQPFAIVSGPESIEHGWWDSNQMDREYYIAHSRQGSLWWVFREAARPNHWYLHGVFG